MPNPTPKRARPRIFQLVVGPLRTFLREEAASGVLLLACAAAAIAWATLDPSGYRAAFGDPLSLGAGGHVVTFTLRALINDGLMAIFFFVVGMEIKRELVAGELDSIAKAGLPGIAAIGGMAVPTAIYLALNWGGEGERGWGIPMATDIAFCVGILAILGDRVPRSLLVFITALAIFDDVGGIVVIAAFYGHGIAAGWLLGGGALALLVVGMNRAGVINVLAYAVVGAGLCYAFHRGGIHPAIAGVLVGLAIPARPERRSRAALRPPADDDSPIQRIIARVHPYVAFIIMPVFALANSGISLGAAGFDAIASPVAAGAAIGLFVGKPIGIFAFAYLAIKLGWAPMPREASRAELCGVSILGGIGFTVALFIATLAFADDSELLGQAKIGIVVGSIAAGLIGFLVIRIAGSSKPIDQA